MPSFWDPICPPQGIVCLKSYLENKGFEVVIRDFNTDGNLFNLQRKYFEVGLENFPHWKFLNIFRNGPRYFARHQLAYFFGKDKDEKYYELVKRILNFDGKTYASKEIIDKFDEVNSEIFKILKEKTDELVKEVNPDVVGCTMLESTFPSAIAILKRVKQNNLTIKTIFGGPGPLMGDKIEHGNLENIINKCDWVDSVIYGEGERLLENYLKGKFNNKKIIGLESLKEVSEEFNDNNLLMNLDEIPKLNYEGLDVKRYLWLSLFTSRGCPFKCSFCFESGFWKFYRKRNISKVIDEFSELSKIYNNNKFYLSDSLVNPIVNDLTQALQNNDKNFEYDTYVRVTSDCFDNEIVKRWAESGMKRARVGVESTSSKVLKLMNKGITPESIKLALQNFANNGIFTSTLWIAGFPEETNEDFKESIDFLKENSKYIYQADVWEFVPSPEGFVSATREYKAKLTYPEEFNDMLVLKYYELEDTVSKTEKFERIAEFEKARIEAGVPNPYSIMDLFLAEKRWMELGYIKN